MTPIVILAPIIVILIGPGLQAITLVTFLIGCFPAIANSTMGLVSTDRNLLDLFSSATPQNRRRFSCSECPI